MIKTVLLIIFSFFAVIGIIECFVVMIETLSMSKYNNIKKIAITTTLEGNIPDVTFFLNTLLLQAERIRYKNVDTKVVIRDEGLDDYTYSQIYEFCVENDNITVEKQLNM